MEKEEVMVHFLHGILFTCFVLIILSSIYPPISGEKVCIEAKAKGYQLEQCEAGK